ncbi:MAG: MFS transporter [Actinobacteria bacterium]|nr:MFS transporter [Actinomycetota bacterium]
MSVLVAAAAVNFAAGMLFAWSVFVPSLRADLGASPATLSAVFSASLVVFAAVVLTAGPLTDRRGPRSLAVASATTAGAGLGLTAAAPSVAVVALGYGGLFGLASGLGYVTVVTVASTRFGPRRGLALGIVVGAYAAGPIVVGPLATVSIDALDWRVTAAVLAVAVAAVTLVAAGWLPSGPASQESSSRSSSDSGTVEPSRPARVERAGVRWLWLLFLFASAPGLLVFAHATDIGLERGLAGPAAGGLVGLLAAGNLAGRLLAGPLSDRLGTVAVMAAALGALTVAVVALGGSASASAALLALPVVGLEYGAVSTLLPAATADLVGRESFGASYGRAFSAWGVAGLVGPLAGARLQAVAGDYRPVFLASVAAAVAALVALAAFARLLRDAG